MKTNITIKIENVADKEQWASFTLQDVDTENVSAEKLAYSVNQCLQAFTKVISEKDDHGQAPTGTDGLETVGRKKNKWSSWLLSPREGSAS